MGRTWRIFLAGLTAALMTGNVGSTSGSLLDRESSTGNIFASLTPTLWEQTTQADFEAGVLNNVDTSSSSGAVTLAANCTAGSIASRVLDTGIATTRWDALFWNETIPDGTNVTFDVRAGDVLFDKDEATPSWSSAGVVPPAVSGLPSGRYKQWKATLSTSNTSNTPALMEVRAYYH
jgi:hypothetical protein